jgi:nicotinamidase-related amidase
MDVQRGVVERFDPVGEAYLGRLRSAASAARAAGLPVIYVKVAMRPGAPEMSRRNKIFGALAGRPGFDEDSPATELHPGLGAEPGDLVCTKRRVSAFAGSDLEVLLRGLEVDELVLAGIATSGVVLSTLRQAADLDFRLSVLADGCLDRDEEVHRVLVEKVFVGQATVVGTDEWVAGLRS